MARRRGEPRRKLSSVEVGGAEVDETVINLAKAGTYPEDYEENSDSWRRAYDHCANNENTVKACINFADAHEGDEIFAAPEEPGGPS